MVSIGNDEHLVFDKNKSTSVSQAQRALPEYDNDLKVNRSSMRAKQNDTIRIANDQNSREQAYRLAYQVYRCSGYIDQSSDEWCVSPYDAHPKTLTLLAKDDAGVAQATVSTVYDSKYGLPCDDVYHDEIKSLRQKGFALAEVTRLAINSGPSQAHQLLLELFNSMYLFTRHVRGYRYLVVEVNPRHAGYYQRLLMFEVIGSQRSCPRVKGAPAVLMLLDLKKIEQAVRADREGASSRSKVRYCYDYSFHEEKRRASELFEQHRSMSYEEASYFGLHAQKTRMLERSCI